MRVLPRMQIKTRVLVTLLCVSSFLASRNRLFQLIPSESSPSSSSSAMAGTRAEQKLSVPSCNSTALKQLGKHGRWVQDWNFVRQFGYTRGDVVQSGPLIKGNHGQFRPSPDAPFPWPSSWRWVGRDSERQHVAADMARNGALATNNNNGHDNNRLFYPVDPMTPRNMCHLLVNQLNIRKIAFYGDSLTMQQADSFLNLFGSSYIETLSSFSSNSPSSPLFSMEQVKYSLNCPLSPAMESLYHSRHTANSIHTTNNNINSTTHATITIPIFMQKESGGKAFPHSPRTNFEFSMEFHYFLTANPSPIENEEKAVEEENSNHETQSQNQIRHHHRSLVVFNIGAHYHNTTWYQQDMLKLLRSLKDIGHPDDLYFFRTNVPGHVHCQPTSPQTFDWKRGTREIPYRDLDEFRTSLEKKGGGGGHDWEKFPMWNEISKDMIRQFNNVDNGVERDGLWKGRTAELSSGTILSPSSLPIVMHVLDVFDMTALRRDGHNALKGDCLHYVLPGPPDWWNHLMYSYLRELSGVLRDRGLVNCRP